jgi:phosphoenolpyruvate carboxykinase (GTP)
MALADIFTRPAPQAAPRRTAGSAVFGRRPAIDGDGMRDLVAWVDEIAALTQPDSIHWVEGSRAENDALLREMVDEGKIIKLNPEWRPGSYLARSHPSDVARTEGRTFIASELEEDAGPTNNWIAPSEIRATITALYEGSMRARTLYFVPFSIRLSWLPATPTSSPSSSSVSPCETRWWRMRGPSVDSSREVGAIL